MCSKGLGETSQLQGTKIMVFEPSALVYHATAHPFQVAVYQGISGSLRGMCHRDSYYQQKDFRVVSKHISSMDWAAPWIIAFLAAVAYGRAAHPRPALFISPHWDRQWATIFLSIIIDRLPGKCLLASSPDSKVSLLTRRFSDTPHPCSLQGRGGCLLMLVWCCSHGQAAR